MPANENQGPTGDTDKSRSSFFASRASLTDTTTYRRDRPQRCHGRNRAGWTYWSHRHSWINWAARIARYTRTSGHSGRDRTNRPNRNSRYTRGAGCARRYWAYWSNGINWTIWPPRAYWADRHSGFSGSSRHTRRDWSDWSNGANWPTGLDRSDRNSRSARDPRCNGKLLILLHCHMSPLAAALAVHMLSEYQLRSRGPNGLVASPVCCDVTTRVKISGRLFLLLDVGSRHERRSSDLYLAQQVSNF